MDPEVDLRPLREEELPYAAALYTEALEWADTSMVEAMAGTAWTSSLTASTSLWRLAYAANPIGIVGLEKINMVDRSAAPFIAIFKQYRGTGMSMKVAAKFYDFVFNEMNLRRLEVRVLPTAPSIPILDSIGFVLEGTHKEARFKRDKYIDVLTYAHVRG